MSVLFTSMTGCGRKAGAEIPIRIPRENSIRVELATVNPWAGTVVEEFAGEVSPVHRTKIVSRVEGIVLRLHSGEATRIVADEAGCERLGLQPGEFVKAGDVLARLDSTNLEFADAISQAKLDREEAELASLLSWKRPEEVDRLTALRDEAQRQYEQAAKDYLRIRKLTDKQVVTPSEVERSGTTAATAQAQLRSAKAQLRAALGGATAADIAVKRAEVAAAAAMRKQAAENLALAVIKAPHDGFVTAVRVAEGDYVGPSTDAICEIVDLRQVLVDVSVPESRRSYLRLHDEVKILHPSDEPIYGRVISIDKNTAADTRMVSVRVVLKNEAASLQPGQFVRACLRLSADQGRSSAVPTSAVVFREGQPCVFAYNGGRLSQTPIQLGLTAEHLTEVSSGLSVGARVVLRPSALLSDGCVVTVANDGPGQIRDESPLVRN